MNRLRLEQITDGIFAIIITVMLLELKIPQGSDLYALKDELHIIFSYVLSFIYVGIYWNNHHHLFQIVKSINGKILWINMHLLFWLTMIPLSTGWLASTNYAPIPAATYALILFMCSLSYRILERAIIHHEGKFSVAASLLGQDRKLLISVFAYGVAIFLSVIDTKLTLLALSILAAFWFMPHKNIEGYFKN